MVLTLDVRKWPEAAAKVDWRRLAKSQEEAKAIEAAISRAFWFMFSLTDRTYAGRGVRLGDKDKPVFWYRPKESGPYRVIYGDLRAGEVAPEDLPKRPATQPVE